MAAQINSSSSSSCSSSSLSSSSSTPQLTQVVKKPKHDVFLSFSGEDTRNTFTCHLHYALCEKGVQTFIDNQLIRGEEIAPSLIKTIRQSKISIVVFSKNYASSPWCLEELVNIMECRNSFGQLVWPLFFNVDPSHVRNHEKGCFKDALALYEADSTNKYKQKLLEWKIALNKAGNLSGWHLDNGNESQLIQRVVEAALSKLNRTPLYVAKYPVGIEDRLEDLGSLMNIGADGVRVIGIYGLGGIGKTTIAKAVFNKFADEFEGSSFLANVRETSKQYCGLIQLQETLLFDMLGDKNLKVGNIHRGINIIRERLCNKRVLIVLDNVDRLDQLETLAGGRDWFGSRSRIIITTRYKHFLTAHGADETYKVEGLHYDEALELLSWNAFKRDKPIKGYYKLSKCVVGCAEGLPLALNVLGSFLCDKDKDEWQSAISNLERKLNKEVYEMLKISYDALPEDEQAIFLDIACFFVGENKDYIIKILESTSGFSPTIGIRVLNDMSLITIESGKVQMHHLVQEMAKEIVCKESSEIGMRSRLWLAEDIFHVFLENTGTNAIKGIKLDLPEKKTLYLTAKAFKKMKSLRLLIFRNVDLSTTIENLPTELRVIDWPGYQFPTLPFNSGPKQLVILNMPYSHIQQLGEGFKNFGKLKIVNLSCSKFLTKIPNLSTAPNIESLYLDHCTNLIEIHESLGSLIKLGTLDLQFCCNLKILPSSLRSKYLKTLNLTSCSSLGRFPNIVVKMKKLKELCLSGTAIKKLPDLSRAPNLESLHLEKCTNLVEIHESVGSLNRLGTLNLEFCCNLKILPRSLGSKYLETLNLANCYSLEKFPNILVESKILRKLCLSGGAIEELPSSIEHLVALQTLNLASCRKLVHIPSSIYKLHQLEHLSLRDCSNLCKFPNNISSSNSNETLPSSELLKLKLLDLQNCNLSEVDFLMTPNGFGNLQQLYLGENKFVSLPSIDKLQKLWYLHLNSCEFLREIPELPRNVSYLYASDCKSLLDIQGKIMAKIKCNKDSEIQVILPRDDIPQWFSHKCECECEGDSVDFIVQRSNEGKEFFGVIVCGVFEVDCKAVRFSLELVGKDVPNSLTANRLAWSQHVSPRTLLYRSILSVKLGHMWLHYLPACPQIMIGNSYKLSFSAVEKPSAKFISRCGVHVLWDEQCIQNLPQDSPQKEAFVEALQGLIMAAVSYVVCKHCNQGYKYGYRRKYSKFKIQKYRNFY